MKDNEHYVYVCGDCGYETNGEVAASWHEFDYSHRMNLQEVSA